MSILLAQTKAGTVRGQFSEYQASTIFKGIPYAKAPVGDLRWRAPQPVEPWEGVRDAIEYGPIALQAPADHGSFYGHEFYPCDWPMSEDCLYLNIITPAATPGERLPVVVWIHGGGFVGGYSQKLETSGEAFAKRGVIYVSINYRLNVFGYARAAGLDAEDPQAGSGNYGTLDQIAALQWVHDNIAAFGGDPERVTIQGQSAGAMSVYELMCSPRAKGLFAGAIMESGGGPMTYYLGPSEESVDAFWDEFFAELGGDVDAARAIPAEELEARYLAAAAKHPGFLPAPKTGTGVLPKSALESMRAADYADIPILLGSTADEDATLSPGLTQARDSFLAGAVSLSARTAQRGSKAFLYHITNVVPGEPFRGAWHSSEHMYIFQTFLRSTRPFSGADLDLSNDMCAYWCNFIKVGDPNGEGLAKWDTYDPARNETMVFDRAKPRAMEPVPAYDGNAAKLVEGYLAGIEQ